MLRGSQPPNPLTDNRLREDIVKELDRRDDYESRSSGVVIDLLRTGRDLPQKNGASPEAPSPAPPDVRSRPALRPQNQPPEPWPSLASPRYRTALALVIASPQAVSAPSPHRLGCLGFCGSSLRALSRCRRGGSLRNR